MTYSANPTWAGPSVQPALLTTPPKKQFRSLLPHPRPFQDFSAIDIISYLCFYTSPDANLLNFPLSDKPSCFCDSPHTQRGCPSSSYVGPASPSPPSTLRASWHRLSILYRTLELSQLPFYWALPISFPSDSHRFHSMGKKKTPPSTHFPARVIARTLSFP